MAEVQSLGSGATKRQERKDLFNEVDDKNRLKFGRGRSGKDIQIIRYT
jgi:hypothetical protein